jgi:Fungal Zn(2)-Cys(6) binuclear cluster domain
MAHTEMYPNGMDEAQDETANFDESGSSPEDTVPTTEAAHTTEAAARAKRIACVICRKRKLKCDGQRPACGTCSRLGHRCGYDEIRRKSGPKRGYVKELEARLKVIESQLKSKQNGSSQEAGVSVSGLDGTRSGGRDLFAAPISLSDPSSSMGVPDLLVTGTPETSFPWEMIGLGLEEALPPQDMIDELYVPSND